MRSAIADGWQREMQRLEAQLLDLQHELRREREQVGQPVQRLECCWLVLQGLQWWCLPLVVQRAGARLRSHPPLHCMCSSVERGGGTQQ